MSLLNDILGGSGLGGALGGALGGQAGAQQGAHPLLQILMSLLAGQHQGGAGAGIGGLGDLISAFQRNGLGDVVQSWIGTGQNLPISAEQLQQVLGGDLLGQIAAQLGTSRDDASSGVADALPQLVDRLTPRGELPTGGPGGLGDLGDLASFMQSLGARRG